MLVENIQISVKFISFVETNSILTKSEFKKRNQDKHLSRMTYSNNHILPSSKVDAESVVNDVLNLTGALQDVQNLMENVRAITRQQHRQMNAFQR